MGDLHRHLLAQKLIHSCSLYFLGMDLLKHHAYYSPLVLSPVGNVAAGLLCLFVYLCLFLCVRPDRYLHNHWMEFLNFGHDDGLCPGNDALSFKMLLLSGIPDTPTKLCVSNKSSYVISICSCKFT